MSTKHERHLKPSNSPLPYHGGGQISTTNAWRKLVQAGQRSNIGKTISDSNLTELNHVTSNRALIDLIDLDAKEISVPTNDLSQSESKRSTKPQQEN